MTGAEYEKYKDIFPELTDRDNWIFDGDVGIPHHSYIGPSIAELKKQYAVDDYIYDI